jgi:hypothetical protein
VSGIATESNITRKKKKNYRNYGKENKKIKCSTQEFRWKVTRINII